jgi:hypothetical protein
MHLATPEDVLQLNTGWLDYMEQPLMFDELKNVLGILGCYWGYQGEYRPGQPHAKWSSGLCAADFFNLADVLKIREGLPNYEGFRNLVAYNVLRRMRQIGGKPLTFDAVVGSATGTTDLAKAIATQTGTRHIEMAKPSGSKDQIWLEGQELLADGSVVLHVEELTSTLSTPPRVRVGIRNSHEGTSRVIKFSPVLMVVVDRRPQEEQEMSPEPIVDGSIMIRLFSFPSVLYQPGPDTCPMCAAGSEPIRPREGDNWARLTCKAA